MTEQIELTRLSSKGQVVIPQEARKRWHLEEGETFAVFGDRDMIILKRVAMPSPREAFAKAHRWGVALAKKRRLKEEDLQEMIERSRRRRR